MLSACGGPPPGDDGGLPDAGLPGAVETVPWRELPEERLALRCRPLIGAGFHSVDPAAPTHWRAVASNVLLRSDDEGATWTRAPVDPSIGVVLAGPVALAVADINPLALNDGRWRASPDRGATWGALDWRPATETALPPGSLVADVGATRVAWTPTGRVLHSVDQGQTWNGEPDALASVGHDFHAASGPREWLGHTTERGAYASSDWGRTWERREWRDLLAVWLQGEAGVIARSFEGFLWVSRDDGRTWRNPERISGAVAVGPAEGELWALSKPGGVEPVRLMHSTDWGQSFASVRVDLGAAGSVTDATPVGPARRLADGRTLLVLELPGVDTLSPRVICTTATSGSLEQPSPAKDDTPGTVTLWARARPGQALGSLQQVVPLSEPGRAYWLGDRTFDDAVAITGGTRTVSGNVALLLKPVEVLRRDQGPPMFVRELEPVNLTPAAITRFDNLLELDGSGRAKYLASHTLQALPDGSFRTDTSEGDYVLGGSTAMWAPWPSGSSWGRTGVGMGVAVVTKEFVGATQYFRLISDYAEKDVFCDVATLPTSRCIAYPGHVRDFAHRNGRVYVLDDWRGEVLEAAFANLDGAWRPVVTGLATPTSLFLPLDADPGIYVVDTHLYRFVPGPMVTGRRP
jgi:photosystem II stability/assembly factor-like uncharacterized protein